MYENTRTRAFIHCFLVFGYPGETSGVTRALIGGGGGGCIFIYSCSARRISFEIKFISKEIRRAEHEYMNIHPPPPN